MKSKPLSFILVLLTVLAIAFWFGQRFQSLPAGSVALDYAFRFASAIRTDAKDRGKAQEQVVIDYAGIGATSEAVRRADLIEGWRRGTAYADLAIRLSNEGRKTEARKLIAKAEALGAKVQGWQGPRILAHVAKAYAALGDVDATKQLHTRLHLVRDESTKTLGATAASLAASGRFDAAMEDLGSLRDQLDYDVTWWRTDTYLEIARQNGLTAEQRHKALQGARRSAVGVPGWKKFEALGLIADEFLRLGDTKSACEALALVEEKLLPMKLEAYAKAPLMAELALRWAAAGEPARSRALLEKTEPLVPELQPIEQPALLARLAACRAQLGDTTGAWQGFDRALQASEELVNARPRALAVVEVCRLIGKQGMELPGEIRNRLEALLEGLKAPW